MATIGKNNDPAEISSSVEPSPSNSPSSSPKNKGKELSLDLYRCIELRSPNQYERDEEPSNEDQNEIHERNERILAEMGDTADDSVSGSLPISPISQIVESESKKQPTGMNVIQYEQLMSKLPPPQPLLPKRAIPITEPIQTGTNYSLL